MHVAKIRIEVAAKRTLGQAMNRLDPGPVNASSEDVEFPHAGVRPLEGHAQASLAVGERLGGAATFGAVAHMWMSPLAVMLQPGSRISRRAGLTREEVQRMRRSGRL